MIIDDIRMIANNEYLKEVAYKMAIKRTKNPLVKLGNWITILIMILGLMPDTMVIRVITTILWVMVIPGWLSSGTFMDRRLLSSLRVHSFRLSYSALSELYGDFILELY